MIRPFDTPVHPRTPGLNKVCLFQRKRWIEISWWQWSRLACHGRHALSSKASLDLHSTSFVMSGDGLVNFWAWEACTQLPDDFSEFALALYNIRVQRIKNIHISMVVSEICQVAIYIQSFHAWNWLYLRWIATKLIRSLMYLFWISSWNLREKLVRLWFNKQKI